MDQKKKTYALVAGYAKLAGYTMNQVAKELGITRRTLSNKINGITDFTLSEAIAIKKLLGKTLDEIFLHNDVA